MRRLSRIPSFLALVVILLLAGVAAMPAVLAEPSTPTVVATTNAGELRATWSATAGAQFYVVGWANREEVSQMIAGGREWLDAFHYATIPANYTGHTITGIKSSTEYAVIVGAKTTRFGGDAPTWSQWSFATTAGQHGEGFCPITGLPLPPGGYLSVGDTLTYLDASFRLDSAGVVPSVTFAGETFVPLEGALYLNVCGSWTNRTGGNLYHLAGSHNNLSTDAGIGFVNILSYGWLDASPIPNGQTNSACDVWIIPDSATAAVYAIYDSTSTGNAVLYQISLP